MPPRAAHCVGRDRLNAPAGSITASDITAENSCGNPREISKTHEAERLCFDETTGKARSFSYFRDRRADRIAKAFQTIGAAGTLRTRIRSNTNGRNL